MNFDLAGFTDDEIGDSQPLSLASTPESAPKTQVPSLVRPNQAQDTQFDRAEDTFKQREPRPARGTGQHGEFRSIEEIDPKYRSIFSYPYFNLVQSKVIDDALYSDRSMVICAPTGSGKTVVFEMAIVQLLMELEDMHYTGDFKIIYMAPVKALCTERLSEWYPKFGKLGLMCIEVTGDTNVDFSQLQPYRIIITTPEKWDMLTRRWRDHRALVGVVKLFLVDEVHTLNDDTRGPVLEAVVTRMKTIESSSQSAYRIERLQKQYQSTCEDLEPEACGPDLHLPLRIRFVAVSATVSNPQDVAAWLGTADKPAVYHKFGDECRPVRLKRVVEGYPCPEGTSIFKFDIILNYKLWPIIQRYHNGKPTLIFCNTRKSVAMTAEALSRELTISFSPEQKSRLVALASSIKNKKLQTLVLSGVGCHHAGLLYEERLHVEEAFRNRDLPILITTTTLAMGVNLPAHLVIVKNTQQYVNGAYQEYSISTVLQMVGRAGRPQYDTEATAVIMTRLQDKHRYQALVGGDEPLQSYLHKRLPENLNSEAALGTVNDVAQCVQWLQSTFLSVRATKDPRRYLGLPPNVQPALISKKIEELCVRAMNGLASAGLITMDEASCIQSTEAGRLMSIYYLDLDTMKIIMKIKGTETLEQLLWVICESHELADTPLRLDERRALNTLNRTRASATVRYPIKGKITTRQMKVYCLIQAVLGCLPIPDPSLNQEAMKLMRIADRVCKCLLAYITRPELTSRQPQNFTAVTNAVILNKCVSAHLWEGSPYMSKQLKGIGPTLSALLAAAGKVNFALIEEAHPRDLERIMNKSAPAGNVVRKQVSLLPSYQLSVTPLDPWRVRVRLALLNRHALAGARDPTAGDTHRAHVIAGDSENYLLLFTTFKDKDLINVFDGEITYEITRKHSFEHKLLVHCISTNWIGIDVHCEYTFENIEPSYVRGKASNVMPTQDVLRPPTQKQTTITDVYKQRKRRNTENDVTESKEKKKRETALIEKFKLLKNSFEATSKEVRQELDETARMSNMFMNEMIQVESDDAETVNKNITGDVVHTTGNKIVAPGSSLEVTEPICDVDYPTIDLVDLDYPTIDLEDLDYPTIDLEEEENFEVDDKIDNILNDIESEMCKTKDCLSYVQNETDPNLTSNSRIARNMSNTDPKQTQSVFFTEPRSKNPIKKIQSTSATSKFTRFPYLGTSVNEKRKCKALNANTNYSFIDKLEKNNKIQDDDVIPQKGGGFSDTIKSRLEKFLQKISHEKENNISITELLETSGPADESLIDLNHFDSNRVVPLPVEKTEEPNIIDITKDGSSDHNSPDTKIYDRVTEDITLDKTVNSDILNVNDIMEFIEREYVTTREPIETQQTGCNTDQQTDVRIMGNNKDLTLVPFDNNVVQQNIIKAIENNNETNIQSNHIFVIDHKIKNETSGNNKSIQVRNATNNLNLTTNFILKQAPDKMISNIHSFDIVKSAEDLKNNVLQGNTTFPLDHIGMRSFPTRSEILSNFKTEANNSESRVDYKDNNRRQKLCNEGNNMNTIEKAISTLPSYKYHPEIVEIGNRCGQGTQENKSKENSQTITNQYKYSATKVDVYTKHLPDQRIQIIQKLKLDLDVTEIISKDSNSSNSTQFQYPCVEDEHYKDLTYKNREVDKIHIAARNIPKSDLQYVAKNKAITKELNYLALPPPQYDDTWQLCEINERVTNNKDKLEQPAILNEAKYKQSPNRSSPNLTKVNYCINTNSGLEENAQIERFEEKETKIKEIDELEHYKKYLREIAATEKTHTESKQSETEKPQIENEINSNSDIKDNKLCEETKSNKIESILQKYSNILRKGNKAPVNSQTEDKMLDSVADAAPTKKPRKPFKISDIQNLDISLPKCLIAVEATRTPNAATGDIATRIKEVNYKQEIVKMPQFTNTTNLEEENKITEYSEVDSPEDIPPYRSPVTDVPQSVEFPEDYDLDQSMLNPKALLEQCYTQDIDNENDDILPPPPAFCDDDDKTIDSPIKLLNEISDLSSPEYTAEQNETFDAHDKSIFEEENSSVLTPSVEIETWTLSHAEDEPDLREPAANRWTPHASRTVMRRNPTANRDHDFSHNFDVYSNSRQGKLSNFKFNHKSKLKLK